MRVLVTGGAGFIGGNLCRHLSGLPTISEVVVYDDLSTGMASNLEGLRVKLVKGSILDRMALDQVARATHGIVHLAARPSVQHSFEDPRMTHDVNVTGTVNVLEVARRNGAQVIVASSSSVYGATTDLPKSESLSARPLSPYAVSKLAAEQYALAWQRSFGLKVLVFRFFNVFGPLQRADHAYAAVVPSFIDAGLNGAALSIYGDGHQTRDFTYVETVTKVIADALTGQVSASGPVNLALGTRTDLNQLIALLEETIGQRFRRQYLPSRPGDVRDSQADSRLLLSLFPGVEAVPLKEGLARTVAWFKSCRGIADQGSQ